MSNIEESAPGAEQHHSFFQSRNRRTLVMLGFFVTLVVFGYFFWQFLKQPAIGTVPVLEDEGEKEPELSQKINYYDGQYVAFSIASDFVEKSHVIEAGGPVLESILFSTTDVEGRKVALVIADRGTVDLMADPSFQKRLNPSEGYEQRIFSVGQFQGTLFQNKTLPSEATFFFVHHGKIVSLSATSPFGTESLEQSITDILQSLRFKVEKG